MSLRGHGEVVKRLNDIFYVPKPMYSMGCHECHDCIASWPNYVFEKCRYVMHWRDKHIAMRCFSLRHNRKGTIPKTVWVALCMMDDGFGPGDIDALMRKAIKTFTAGIYDYRWCHWRMESLTDEVKRDY